MVNFASLLPVFVGLLGAAEAHTRVWSLWVNDVDQGDGRSSYIRSPPTDYPVKDVSRTDIICNVANTAVPSSVTVAPGDKVTFEWYHNTRGDDIIDGSHVGPITVYIAPASSNGAGAVWTKLAESGLNAGVWAVTTLKANGGKYSLTLPSGLAAGDYLLRAEVIALHEGNTDWTVNHARGAQFYPSCSQITVSGSGVVSPPGGFNFIGGYSPEDPGILFNIYGSFTSYPIPGPAVWDGTGTSSNASTSGSPTVRDVTGMTVSTPSPVTSAAIQTEPMIVHSPVVTCIPIPTAATSAAATPTASTDGTVPKYYQCGGKVWTGATTCVSGCTCVQQNEYYYQCL